jgi:hypothetical protein
MLPSFAATDISGAFCSVLDHRWDGIIRNGDIYLLACLFLTSYCNDVDAHIDVVDDHFSHIWGLLQQRHHLGASDTTTPRFWIGAYFLAVSTHISPWSS